MQIATPKFNGSDSRGSNGLCVAFSKAIEQELSARLRMIATGNRNLPTATPQQVDACKAIKSRKGNVIVGALAGTGKTTLIEHIVSQFPNTQWRASTLHGFGFRALCYHLEKNKLGKPEIKADKVRVLAESIFNPPIETIHDEIKKAKALDMISVATALVEKSKLHGFGAHLPMPTDDNFYMIMDRYEIQPPSDDDESQEYEDAALPRVFALARRVLEANNKQVDMIDFSDMIYLPLVFGVRFLWQDTVLVDESQDLNPVQQEMIRRIMERSRNARAVFVGDRHQAIFGFAGADTESMDTIKNVFKCDELPLSVCFRCPKVVVRLAQEIVPSIEWAEGASDGELYDIYEDGYDTLVSEVKGGDFIICRTTAPLVSLCLTLIGRGVAATVRGRDIGKSIKALVGKIKKFRFRSDAKMIEKIDAYEAKQLSKVPEKDKAKRESISDRIAAVRSLAESCNNWDDIIRKVDAMFSDVADGETSNNMVVLCTAHRAKGLQAKNVYIIHPELMPFPFARTEEQVKQEWNLKYVAYTRAMEKLTRVHNQQGTKFHRTRWTIGPDGNLVSEDVTPRPEPTPEPTATPKKKRTRKAK